MPAFAFVEQRPKCDMCDKEAQYDARTVMGPWAFMCADHFSEFSVGVLGTGFGQILVVKGDRNERS